MNCVVAAPETRSHVSEVLSEFVWVLLGGDKFIFSFIDMEVTGF
jgi:hypothetical protein